MAYKVQAGGQVRGLVESAAAFRGLGPLVEAAHRITLQTIATETKTAGQAAYQSRVGGTRERRQPGSIGTDFGREKFIVFIERDGTSPAAEFGAKSHTVFGRKVSQRSMKNRTAGGWSRKGKLVGPQLEPYKVKRQSKRVADKGLESITRQLNRYGVPKR